MPHRLIPRRLREHMGRRGVILALFGVMWFLMGVAYFTMPDLLRADANGFWHERMSPYFIGAMWGGSGLVSIIYGFLHNKHNDTYGFNAVTLPPLVLSVSFLVGTFTRALVGDPTWFLGFVGFLIYGIFTITLAVIASWPDVEGGDRG